SSASSAFTASVTRPNSRSSSAAKSSTTTTTSNRPNESWSSDGRRERAEQAQRPRTVEDLHAGGHQRHPHEGRTRSLPNARVLDLQGHAALGRPDVPAGNADALRDRGLPGEVRDEDGPRGPLRKEADRARHPDLHHGDELRGALARGTDGVG